MATLGSYAVMHGTTTGGILAPAKESFVGYPARRRIYAFASRCVDIAIASTALLFAMPVLALAALAIRLTSRGPVFFRQKRAGFSGEPFVMYKLRTMHVGADDEKELFRSLNALPTGPCFKMRNDPRVTRVGRWLRRLSIDELPQLINVLKGEMAVVGPRPLPMDEAKTDTKLQRLRMTVKPGLTCLWQVSGRTEIPYEEWLQLDVFYIRNQSLKLDLEIVLRTIPAVLSMRGAY
ncbi:MAG TPA: sugar transferase [Phycisphaerae bacterium]|nr:sugar transferase [Phycisphaerae bacterium]HRW52029.1 sugar transferase [Phycisphaerae bacterium]